MNLSIKSSRSEEIAAQVNVDGKTRVVQTDDQVRKSRKIITNTCLDGAVVDTVTTDYSDIVDESDVSERLKAMIAQQHKAVKDFFCSILYLNLGRAYVIGNKNPEAINAFQNGIKKSWVKKAPSPVVSRPQQPDQQIPWQTQI